MRTNNELFLENKISRGDVIYKNISSSLLINFSVLIVTFLASIYILYNNSNTSYDLLFILPIIYAICYFLLIEIDFSNINIFHLFFTVIGFFRYVILPTLIVISGYYTGRSPLNPRQESFELAFYLMAYELITSSILIKLLSAKHMRHTQTIIKRNVEYPENKVVYCLFSFVTIVLIILNPSCLSSLSFIRPNINAYNYDDFNIMTQLTIMCSTVLKQLIFIMFLSYFKKKYEEHKSNSYIFFSLILVILNSLIYFGTNRSDFVLTVLASGLVFAHLYKKMMKFTIIPIVLILVFVLPQMSEIRNIFYISGGSNKLLDLTDTLQTYLGGPYNVSIAIETAEMFPNGRNILTLIFDLCRPTLGLNFIFKQIPLNYTNEYFNARMFFSDKISQIIPMIGEGYYIFGFILSPLINLVFIKLAFFLHRSRLNANRIETLYFLSLSLMRLGFMMGQNAMIQMNDLSFNIFLPMLIFFLNNKVVSKKRKQE